MIKVVFVLGDLLEEFKRSISDRTSKFDRRVKEIDDNIYQVTVNYLKEDRRPTIFFFVVLKKYSQEEAGKYLKQISITASPEEILILSRRRDMSNKYSASRYQFDPKMGRIYLLKNDESFSKNEANEIIAIFVVSKKK